MTSPSRPQVYLHVGAAKSGTTYLQSKLWFNRRRLREAGFCYPGERFPAHVWAALDLRDARFRGVLEPQVPGAWQRLVDEIRRSGVAGIIDQELFAAASPEQIEQAFQDLSFADVHIVFTLRDMARNVPAAWQERLKNREVTSYAEFLRAIHEPPEHRSRHSREFWAMHDAESILSRWTQAVPRDRVHIVTVPPPGSDPTILWERFASAVRLPDPAGYRERTYPNASLSAAEAAVVRRLNLELGGDRFPWQAYNPVVKQDLAVQLAKRQGLTVGLPEAEYDWAVEWCRRTAEFIATKGWEVIGDLDDLIPAARRAGVDPDAVDPAAQLDAAVAGMAVLVRRAAEDRAGGSPDVVGALQQRLEELEGELRERREEAAVPRMKRALVELSGQMGWLGKAYGGYRKARGALRAGNGRR